MNRITSGVALSALLLGLAACGAREPAESSSGTTPTAPAATETASGAETPAAEQPAETPAASTTPAETPAAAEMPEESRTVGTSPGELIPEFAAKGTHGESESVVASQAPGAVTVYCAGSTTCPFTNKYGAKMAEIEATYTAKGVKFVWLYPNRTESDDDKAAWHADNGLAGTFVIDRDAKLAKILEITKTPEMVVTDANGTITYRGAIDDGRGKPSRAKTEWLANAIDATLAGEPVEIRKTVPAG